MTNLKPLNKTQRVKWKQVECIKYLHILCLYIMALFAWQCPVLYAVMLTPSWPPFLSLKCPMSVENWKLSLTILRKGDSFSINPQIEVNDMLGMQHSLLAYLPRRRKRTEARLKKRLCLTKGSGIYHWDLSLMTFSTKFVAIALGSLWKWVVPSK